MLQRGPRSTAPPTPNDEEAKKAALGAAWLTGNRQTFLSMAQGKCLSATAELGDDEPILACPAVLYKTTSTRQSDLVLLLLLLGFSLWLDRAHALQYSRQPRICLVVSSFASCVSARGVSYLLVGRAASSLGGRAHLPRRRAIEIRRI